MLHRDYLMRQIEELGQVLAQVLFNKSNQQYDEAIEAIDRVFSEQLGHGLSDLRHQPIDQLIRLCSTPEGLSEDFTLRVADLLYEDGKIRERRSDGDAGCRSLVRALALYAEAVIRGDDTLPWNIFQKIESLRSRVERCEQPEGLRERLQNLRDHTP
jgi:hypothetical protein